ncbi:MAG: hypothetical protein H6822_21485 [Planctomycetaceae bacterium]|nr:hypothetical protein [Planctomycetales bacterium]MCB9924768.1 hypothetical protein [Planctomycetaceae bacterium]
MRLLRIPIAAVLIIALLATTQLSWAQDTSSVGKTAQTPSSNTQPVESLPWADQQDHIGDLPARRLVHAREFLNLLSIDESQLASFADGEPLGPQDEETVRRILYRMPRFALNDLHRWAETTKDLEPLINSPEEHRADTFLLRGRTTNIERVELLAEAVERLEFDHYFRVGVDLDDSPHHAVVCCRRIPLAWASGEILGEPIVATALFMKLCGGDTKHAELAFAAPHVGWLPSQQNDSAGITSDMVTLAQLGMDASLFDEVRSLNRKPITQADRECFYQLLSVVGHADPKTIREHARPNVDLAPLLQEPTKQHGRLMVVRGTARRAMNIRVDDEDIKERFGIDHYYQIDVFIPLGNQVVRLGKQDEGESPTFTNTYPTTVCVLRLPPGLPEGTDIREEVSIPAACFKLWAYRSRFVSEFDQKQLQVSPMFIGAEPQVIKFSSAPNPYFGFAVAGFFVAALAITWFALWRSGKNDSKFTRDVLARRREAPSDRSLNDAGIEEQAEPDFTKWD